MRTDPDLDLRTIMVKTNSSKQFCKLRLRKAVALGLLALSAPAAFAKDSVPVSLVSGACVYAVALQIVCIEWGNCFELFDS